MEDGEGATNFKRCVYVGEKDKLWECKKQSRTWCSPVYILSTTGRINLHRQCSVKLIQYLSSSSSAGGVATMKLSAT